MDAHDLQKVPLDAGLSHKEREKIARWSDTVDLPAGKHLLEQGRLPHEFFVVLEGEVEVTHDGERLAMMGPGDFFGEIALIDEGARSATITAAEELVCYGLTYWDFRPLVQENASISWNLLQSVVKKLRAAAWVAEFRARRRNGHDARRPRARSASDGGEAR